MNSQIIIKLIAQLTVLILLTVVSNFAFACNDAKNDSDTAKVHIRAEQAASLAVRWVVEEEGGVDHGRVVGIEEQNLGERGH